jgi:hypothetical protein
MAASRLTIRTLVLAAIALSLACAHAAQAQRTTVASFKAGTGGSGGKVATFTAKTSGSGTSLYTVKGDAAPRTASGSGPSAPLSAQAQAIRAAQMMRGVKAAPSHAAAPTILATNAICVVRHPGDPAPELPALPLSAGVQPAAPAPPAAQEDAQVEPAVVAEKPSDAKPPEPKAVDPHALKRNAFALQGWSTK